MVSDKYGNSPITQYLYLCSLDSHVGESVGSVDELGWYGRIDDLPDMNDPLSAWPRNDGFEDLSIVDMVMIAKADGAILYEDGQGFVECDLYDSEGGAELSLDTDWQNILDEYEEYQGPQEGDITTNDDKHYYLDGKLIVTVGGDDDYRVKLREWMVANKHFPTVWSISDHGNAMREQIFPESDG